MPSQIARFALLALASLAVSPALAQQLTMPSDPLAGSVIESRPAAPTGAVQITPGNSVPMSGATMAGDGMAGSSGMSYGAPTSAFSSGSAYNPTLGAHLRATYTSESYAQEAGNLSLGTMKLLELGDGFTFLDGQVTMNDESHVGYNLGLGYRWMTLPVFPYSPDAQKIAGVSVWSDGQTIGGDNFFPQVGASLELLGDHIDFRANGYFPVGPEKRTRDFTETGALTYSGNTIAPLLLGVEDTALTVGEAELAGRIMDLDAWVFGGVYGFSGGEVDATGGKVGLRGYATPDLLLSIAITNDDEFDTNAIFSAAWFIGRTRAENCPTGQLSDRYREPVIRNNYVATSQRSFNGAGAALLDNSGEVIRIVHADSTAAPGGDGTFERPINDLDNILANSQTDDIVLAHGASVFNNGQAVLSDGQVFVGEGGNNSFNVNTRRFGSVALPETATGARAGAVPVINVVAGSAGVVLADDNTVQNLSFNGGQNAIVSDAMTGSFNPTLQNLTITGTSADGILLNTVVRADTDDLDDDNNTTETINVMGNVVIRDTTFNNVAGNDINIDADADMADVNSGETITITNVTSNNTNNVNGETAISIANTNNTTGDAVTITNFEYNGGTNRGGGLVLTATSGPVTVTESDFTGGDGPAVDVNNPTGAGIITVGSTNDITDVAGVAVRVIGNAAAVNIGADIATANTVNGGGVFVQANDGIVTFTGAIDANNFKAVEIDDSQANVSFGADADINHTGTEDTITITNAGMNTTGNASVTFSGTVTGGTGRVVNITGGDSPILFSDDVTSAAGQGISIQNRDNVAAATVQFNDQTTITTAAGSTAAGVNLAGNDDLSAVSFSGGLDIDTDQGTGKGLVSDSGIVNVTGTGNTISTATGRGIELTGGSSTQGVTFADVDVNGADTAIFLDDFDGTVTANGGTMTTTGTTAQATNSGLVLNDVVINSGTNVAVGATINDDEDRTVTLTDVDLNGDNVTLTTTNTATGALNATIDNTNSAAGAAGVVGAVTFNSAGSDNSSLMVTDVRTDGDFDYNITGAGNLSATMTNVDRDGIAISNISLDVNGTGNGLLTMNDVNTAGTLSAQSTNTADGDVIVNVTNSGNDAGDAFTSIVVNDLGDGVATASFTTTQSTGGIDFDSEDDGNASLTVSGGTYGGAGINAEARNNGAFTTTINGTTTVSAGGVTIDARNQGATTITTSGTTTLTTGNFSVLATNASNNGNLTTTLNGITTTAGNLSVSKTTTGNATYSLSNLNIASGIDVNSANTGTVAFTMQNVIANASGTTDAVELTFGPNISTGDVDIFGTNTLTAVDASALDVDFTGGGNIDFRVTNGTFVNDSTTAETVAITAAGTSVIDATVSGNTARNTNGASGNEFLIATLVGGSPTLNLNMSGNTANEGGGGPGNGQFRLDEESGTFAIFERDDTINNVPERNDGTIIILPNLLTDFDDLASPPSLPFQ